MQFLPHFILARYFARVFLVRFAGLYLALLAIVYIFDTIEIMRRAAGRIEGNTGLVLQISFFKLPEAGLQILPFAVLFAAMITIWGLSRRHELTGTRAAGISAWQFLMPLLGAGMVLGIISTTILNPVGAQMLKRFETLESRHFGRHDALVALGREGIWLRQDWPGIRAAARPEAPGAPETPDIPLAGTAGDSGKNWRFILHAGKVTFPEWKMEGVMGLVLDADHRFRARIDARKARLEDGAWVIRQGVMERVTLDRMPFESIRIDTPLTIKEIEETFADPETKSFWEMQDFIALMQRTGLETAPLRVHYQSLWAAPFFLMAMILLAAGFTLRPPRQAGTALIFAAGVLSGFGVFFIQNVLGALGAAEQIPVLLAAWAPALMTFLLGLTALLHTEEG